MKKFFYILLLCLVVSVTTLTPLLVNALTSYEYHTAGESTSVNNVDGAHWVAMTFKTASSYNLTAVCLDVGRYGSPSTITVGIRATSGGIPTGADLTSGTYNGDGLVICDNPTWLSEWAIVNVTSYEVSANTTYAIVVRATGGDSSNRLRWKSDSNASDEYANGQRCDSTDSGATWPTTYANDDLFFIILGDEAAPSSPRVYTQAMTQAYTGSDLQFNGYLSGTGSTNVTEVGFQIVVATGNFTDGISIDDSVNYGEPTAFSINATATELSLVTGSTYKYRAYATNDSDTGYGVTLYFVHEGIPQVTSGAVTSRSSGGIMIYSFSGSVTASGTGDGDVATRGFQIGEADGEWEASLQITESPSSTWDGSIGDYILTTTALEPSTTYYWRAYAEEYYPVIESYYAGYGETKSFTTSASGAVSGGTVGGLAGDFSTLINDLMSNLGMDNLFGHWMFMILIIFLVCIIFGAFIIASKDELTRKILLLILGIVVLGIFGGFTFSGLLGVWAVAILVIIAVGLLIVVGGRVLDRGGIE